MKIRIKKSKRGTFTAAAKKHGKGVQAFAQQVLANPENYSPAMRKKANFARNVKHWHKGQYGLNLDIPPEYQGHFDEVDLGDGVKYFDPVTPQALNLNWDFVSDNERNYGNYKSYSPVVIDPSVEQEVPEDIIIPMYKKKSGDDIIDRLHEMPVYANMAQMLTDSFGLTNRPDMRYANAIGRARRNLKYTSPDLSMAYERYQPIDVNLPANMQLAQAAELQRANRATANRTSQMQNALGIYNTASKQYGMTQLQAQQAASAERRAVNQLNNTMNAKRDDIVAKAQQLNSVVDQQRMQNEIAEAAAREASETARAQTISANRKAAFDSLGALGKQRGYQDMLYNLGLVDVFGNINNDMYKHLIRYAGKEDNG